MPSDAPAAARAEEGAPNALAVPEGDASPPEPRAVDAAVAEYTRDGITARGLRHAIEMLRQGGADITADTGRHHHHGSVSSQVKLC